MKLSRVAKSVVELLPNGTVGRVVRRLGTSLASLLLAGAASSVLMALGRWFSRLALVCPLPARDSYNPVEELSSRAAHTCLEEGDVP